MSREFSVDIAPTVRSGTQPTAPVVPSVTGKLPALQSRSTISEFSNRQESPCTLATSAGTRARSTTNSLSPVGDQRLGGEGCPVHPGWVDAGVVGYVGPPPLTLVRVLTAWTVNPPVLVTVLVLAVAYQGGVVSLRRRGGRWPRARSLCFLGGGLGTITVVGFSFIGVYADTLFWVRALQNLVLIMLTPLFFALGAPLTLLRELLPAQSRAQAGVLLHSVTARVLTFPLVVTVVLVAPPLVLYLSPLYELSLRNTVVGGLVGGGLVATGFIYYWSRLRVDPVPQSSSYLVTMWITMVEVLVDAVLGLTLWLGPVIATGYYLGMARTWGPAPRIDQDIGAGILWIGGDIIGLPFLATVVARMTREDETRASVIDAELDAAEARGGPVPGTPVTQNEPSAAPAPDNTATPPQPPRPRLWWEDRPELAERTRRGR